MRRALSEVLRRLRAAPVSAGRALVLVATVGPFGRYGRLLTDAGPDEVMRGLQLAPTAATAAISGFHLFPFGGLRKAGNWLRVGSMIVALAELRPLAERHAGKCAASPPWIA